MDPSTLITKCFSDKAQAEAFLNRLKTGAGLIIIVSESEAKRVDFVYSLTHTIATNLRGDLGPALTHTASTSVVLFDTNSERTPAAAKSFTLSKLTPDDEPTFKQEVSSAARQDPFALTFVSAAEAFMVNKICQQSSMHLVIVGIDAARTDLLNNFKAAYDTEWSDYMPPLMVLTKKDTYWEVS